MDYKNILQQLYKPEMGSLWKAPNRIWTNSFAHNKNEDGYHPSLVEKIKLDGITAQLIPGTSKDYKKGSCVFKVDLNNNGAVSYFLLKLAMPYTIENLLKLERGWDGVETLNEQQLNDFKWQIKICRG